MKVRYFAWLRERLGRDEDDLGAVGAGQTIESVVDRLIARDEVLAAAMEKRAIFKFALDAKVVPATTPVGEAKLLAILPPMTGG
jgi:molybdopterin synthase sulfur carrier subunit